MRLALLLASLALFSAQARATTYQVHSTDSESSIQSTINLAFGSSYNTVKFNAGTYTFSSQLTIPCAHGGTLTGPPANPATAIIVGSFAYNALTYLSGGCNGMTIEYLGFNGGRPSSGGGGGIYVGPGTNDGITITNNQFWGNNGISGDADNWTEGIFFAGDGSSTNSNITVSNNSFGKSGDCAGTMNVVVSDPGGFCAAVVWEENTTNLTVTGNVVAYQEEGFKYVQYNNCNTCLVSNNDFSNIHRASIEFQNDTPGGGLTVEYNDIHDQYVPFYASWGISVPCCGSSNGVTVYDNVIIANVSPLCCGQPDDEYIPGGLEIWGDGSTGNSNLIQGYWANGVQWGYSGVSQVINNYICGSIMATSNTFIKDEEGYTPPPTTVPNTTNSTCTSQQSARPSISPASGAYSTPPTVTLTTYQNNTSIYYTVDGSSPTVNSTLYTGPFVAPALPATIKAIQMWGVAPNPKSYPTGYGYIPGSVVTATYTP